MARTSSMVVINMGRSSGNTCATSGRYGWARLAWRDLAPIRLTRGYGGPIRVALRPNPRECPAAVWRDGGDYPTPPPAPRTWSPRHPLLEHPRYPARTAAENAM